MSRKLNIVVVVIVVFFGSQVVAQTEPSQFPDALKFEALNLGLLAEEDAERESFGLAPRFAIAHFADYTPIESGVWKKERSGRAVWRIRFACENAVSFNFGFGRWDLPVGAEMRLRNTEGTHRVRPFDFTDVQPHGELWTPAVAGNDVIIEIHCDPELRSEVESAIELTSINIGYRGFHEHFKEKASPGSGGTSSFVSGSCNVDVACPESAGWEDEIDCVGVISTGGTTFCTGFMVNNTAQDGTPFFMTADHCGITGGNAGSLVVYWNFQNSFCRPPGSAASGGPGDGTLSEFSTGSIFRAGSGVSDFTLVELTSAPPSAFGVSFCGWNRGTIPAGGAVGIHHPDTDEKRISFENDTVVLAGDYVDVSDWDLGTTEPGSSGSPLFDLNHRVIGQLCCGSAACGNDLSDSYGRISSSWSLGLSTWLDPLGTGAFFVDTIPAGGMSTESCTNGIDDDSDGLVDCNDPDCSSNPACLPPQAGDECTSAIAASVGANAFDTTSLTDSSDAVADTLCTGTFLGDFVQDVWFTYTPPSSGTLSASTCGTASFDTDLAVYSGACGSLMQIGCSGDGTGCPDFSSEVTGIAVTAGVPVLVRVGGWEPGLSGTGTMTLGFTPTVTPENCTNGLDDDLDGLTDCDDPDCSTNPACAAVAGDECTSAVVATLGVNGFDNTGATTSSNSISDALCTGTFLGIFHQDLWFTFLAPTTGDLTASLCGSNFDTDLTVYSGTCASLNAIACSGDSCGVQSEVTGVPVSAGVTYRIRVGGWDNTSVGSGVLNLSITAAPTPEICTNGVDDDLDGLTDCADADCATDPSCAATPGDECADAIPAFLGVNAVDNTAATTSSNPASGAACAGTSFGTMDNDVWYTFTAGSSGTHQVSTCGTITFDSDIEIYVGTCAALTAIACEGDTPGCADFSTIVEFTATAGVTYRIRIGGWSATEIGSGVFQISAIALPDPEDCSNGLDDDGDGATDCADSDCSGDPACVAGPSFRFEAPVDSVSFPQATGATSFTVSLAIAENATSPGFPNQTEGFSLGVAHDPSILLPTAINPAPFLAALNGGGGPSFMDMTIWPDGVTSGIIYDFFGSVLVDFPSSAEVATVTYATVPAALAGDISPTTTALQWSSGVGTPPVESVVVVGGASLTPQFLDGAITLIPGAGGFRRMDCNGDGGTDIADAIAALAGLFSGGVILCVDACDTNDDGSFNIADPISTLGVLFSGDPSPPPPFGACGADPTPDALTCDDPGSC